LDISIQTFHGTYSPEGSTSTSPAVWMQRTTEVFDGFVLRKTKYKNRNVELNFLLACTCNYVLYRNSFYPVKIFLRYFNYRGNIAEKPLNRVWCIKPAGKVEFSSQQFL